MRLLILLGITLMLLVPIACKKKKPETSWQQYQATAQMAIDILKPLANQDIDDSSFPKFKDNFSKAALIVNKFLQETSSQAEKESRISINNAMQDLQVFTEVMDKKIAVKNDSFRANKLFAESDPNLFANVKKRYQLGPELVVASKNYYFIDAILHEAQRSADRNLDRATKRLNDEVAAEIKAIKAAKKGTPTPNPSAIPTPTPTPTSISTPTPHPSSNSKKANKAVPH